MYKLNISKAVNMAVGVSFFSSHDVSIVFEFLSPSNSKPEPEPDPGPDSVSDPERYSPG